MKRTAADSDEDMLMASVEDGGEEDVVGPALKRASFERLKRMLDEDGASDMTAAASSASAVPMDEDVCMAVLAPKRLRLDNGTTTETSFESVVSRVRRWIVAQAERGQPLPRTREKLEHAIAVMCRGWVTVDARVVLFHLLLNEVLVVSEGSSDCQHLVPNRRFDIAALRRRGFLACCSGSSSSSNGSDKFSSEFVSAFWKAAEWVLNNRGLPTATNAIAKCLAQVCIVRRDVSPLAVTTAMCERGFLLVNDASSLAYNIPLLRSNCGSTSDEVPHFQGVPVEAFATIE